MRRINRRDYLLQMGAASALVSVSNLLSPSASSKELKPHHPVFRHNATKATFLFTPKTATPPSLTNLTVLFGGLMGFSNSNRGEVQVGFQKGKGKHKLEINLYQTINGHCFKLPSISSNELANVKTIQLFVRDEPANVNFFHKDDFDRKPTDDRKDFGWIIDFEDSPLYPDGVKITKKFLPVLKLSQGTLYTHQLTNSRFNLIEVPGNTVQDKLNQVPRLMGAAIEIPTGKEAVLKLDGDVAAQLPYIANVRYEIQFMNECLDSGGSLCKWLKPKDPDEKIRNDFHMHYFMFKPINPSAKKYGVIVDQEAPAVSLNMCPPSLLEGTDEAPCMATGFGRQPGF